MERDKLLKFEENTGSENGSSRAVFETLELNDNQTKFKLIN